MKNEKGITAIKLVFLILILIILGIILIYSAKKTIKNIKLENMKTNMFQIQAQVKEISEKNKFNQADYIGTKLSNEDYINIESLIGDIEYEIEDFYILSQEDLNQMGLKNIFSDEKNGFFIVNYKTYEVIHTKGILEEDGIIYNKLSDIRNLEENK